ncbi:CD4-1 molecule [Scophthalmus maximus]|uniref:CD4-1 molecule n=1 Tax=Scophthalmus maximus TaxID=52904 RepID=A0A8D3AEA4_SCOMX|nr:CD4-1 molecule [Scophthalmus maximus]XP_035498058.1 CD4-1 molecule [Scophthalmus maximus]
MGNLIQSVIIFFTLLSSATGAEVVYGRVGETVTLESPAVYTYVYWKFGKEDGLQLAWRNHLGGGGVIKDVPWNDMLALSANSLTIKKIQPENFGTYFCIVLTRNSVLPTITTTNLIKLDVRMNPSSPLLPGESLTLACTTETPQGLKKPEIHWLDPRGERMKNSQGTVKMRVKSQDDGMWTCSVANKKQVQISVKVVDLSPAPLHPQYTSKSSPITVPCSISPHITWQQIKDKGIQEVHWQFFPKPSSGLSAGDPQRLFSLSLGDPLSWIPDAHRELRPAQDPKTGNLALTRKQGREEDRGDYVCTMKFKNGVTMNRTVHVEVLQIVSSRGTGLVSGQSLNLTCSIGRPLPSDLQLQWSPPKPSSLPSLQSDRHPAHLTIPGVSTDDGGNWRCALWQGKTRLTSAAITLKIEPKLSVWMLVIICSAAVIPILLIILGFILCRRRHRKMRHLRHQLCRCKNPKPKGFYRT